MTKTNTYKAFPKGQVIHFDISSNKRKDKPINILLLKNVLLFFFTCLYMHATETVYMHNVNTYRVSKKNGFFS